MFFRVLAEGGDRWSPCRKSDSRKDFRRGTWQDFLPCQVSCETQ
ncbi:hypothetical protein F8B43_4403 [Methylorubrum populi]|uniref:Uncharacterized protein n=1 Tax=Methylorubrum populi TaxID=223967 RepID=A0A833J2N4_9HYPH|nr:hypothetical protein F8B43_4403 [Methylorubrum populi]